MVTGTDVDYGALTHHLISYLDNQPGFRVLYNHEVTDLTKTPNGAWKVSTRTPAITTGDVRQELFAKFVFIGAGGGSLKLLQKSGIPEGEGYGGFPVSGIWLRCDTEEISSQQNAKVYGKAASGSPPMSVPHLDTRIVGGQKSLLFGPYAGFSTRFLKHGSLMDLASSITHDNILPLLDVAKDNIGLTKYLIGQVVQSSDHQFQALRDFYPSASKSNWYEAVAGQRVQTIKPSQRDSIIRGGSLEFGTEIVSAEDKSIVALLGASPGASTAAFIGMKVIEGCFSDRLTRQDWLPKLIKIFPTYGVDLKHDAQACRSSRSETASILNIVDI